MLFDLRGRGRRRTVQVIYLGLAVLMFGGLVLFGVGAGNGFGGLLNAFTGNGSSGAARQYVSQQEKNAAKLTVQQPSNPQAWAALAQARADDAGQGSNYNVNTGNYTAAGQKVAAAAGQAWQRYLQLEPHPNSDLARVMALRIYAPLLDHNHEAQAWEIVTAANPTVFTYYEYLAAAAYQAGQTRKGDLAAAKAISLAPKVQQLTVRQQLQQAKKAATQSSTSTATTPATTSTAG